jgi:hypothetical protein
MNLTTFTSVFIFGICTGVNNFNKAEKINNNLRHNTIVTGTLIKIKDILMNCESLLNDGFILRTSLTIFSFFVIYLYLKNYKNYIYLILPIILTILDEMDNFPLNYTLFKKIDENISKTRSIYKNCIHTFYYQKNDKILDSLTYLFTYLFLALFFKNDLLLLFFVLYRLFGAFMFSVTMDSSWLILFFDFVKEYLLYLFLFGKNFNYLLPFIALKMLFESLFHTIHNPNHYIKN